MKLNVDNVKNTVYRAYEKAVSGEVPMDCFCKELVDYVLDNTHLTYKYILVTALASKATDDTINPLCLQVKSELPGAYDARSICHGVIVRFDMEVLNKALGGSNEPFLNKPARFPELSTSNAVRTPQRGASAAAAYRPCCKRLRSCSGSTGTSHGARDQPSRNSRCRNSTG